MAFKIRDTDKPRPTLDEKDGTIKRPTVEDLEAKFDQIEEFAKKANADAKPKKDKDPDAARKNKAAADARLMEDQRLQEQATQKKLLEAAEVAAKEEEVQKAAEALQKADIEAKQATEDAEKAAKETPKVSLRLHQDVIDAIQAAAKQERKNFSETLRAVVTAGMQAKGITLKDLPAKASNI